MRSRNSSQPEGRLLVLIVYEDGSKPEAAMPIIYSDRLPWTQQLLEAIDDNAISVSAVLYCYLLYVSCHHDCVTCL